MPHQPSCFHTEEHAPLSLLLLSGREPDTRSTRPFLFCLSVQALERIIASISQNSSSVKKVESNEFPVALNISSGDGLSGRRTQQSLNTALVFDGVYAIIDLSYK